MIPDFLPTGILPDGIHFADLEEIRARFCWNGHRQRLLGGFERALVPL